MLALVGPILSKVKLSGAHLGPRLGQVGRTWCMLGTSWAHVEHMLGLCWPMLGWAYVGVCWPHVGLCWLYVEPSWRLCWAYVGDMLDILGLCWGYVYDSSSPKAKALEKPTFFDIAKLKFSAAGGPKAL